MFALILRASRKNPSLFLLRRKMLHLHLNKSLLFLIFSKACGQPAVGREALEVHFHVRNGVQPGPNPHHASTIPHYAYSLLYV